MGTVLDLSADRLSSKLLEVNFNLSYQHAATGLPPTVTFDASDLYDLSDEQKLELCYQLR